MTGPFRVLVADAISLNGLKPLQDDERFEIVVKPGLSGDDLANAIADADAVLVRSATRITRESLARATHLKAIGRAGVGVDTIDVDAATERGVPVLTAPAGNTTSAAELTMALMLALARRVAAADRSMKQGEWDKKSFTGIELLGKTLGLVGAGRIGGEVAKRARAFGMRVVAYDPFLNAERARLLDVEVGSFDDVIEGSDVISVHVPLTDVTRNLIGPKEIARMKKGAFLLNVARGGVIDESALRAGLESKQLGGAALDVFATEPLPKDDPLRSLPNVVLTPHLGASTGEAQHNVAIEIAEAVRSALLDGDLSRAVNAPAVGGEEMRRLRPILSLAERLGQLGAALAGGPLTKIEVQYSGSSSGGLNLIASSAVAGALSRLAGGTVNLVNALRLAQSREIRIEQTKGEPGGDYPELVEVSVTGDRGSSRVAGAVIGHAHQRIVRVDGFDVEIAPRGTLLVMRSENAPAVIGQIGTVLGAAGVTVTEYHQARGSDGASLGMLRVDTAPGEGALASLRALAGVKQVQQVELG